MPLPAEVQLKMKELELKSLFETIRAINSNAPEADLYKIYKFIVRSNPNVKKFALYVHDEFWACKVNFGTKLKYENIKLINEIFEMHEPTNIPWKTDPFGEYHKLIPIKHKQQVLAYVFLGKSETLDDEEKLGIDFIEALTNIIIVAIENKKLARKEIRQKEYKKQLEIAKDVQSLLFPKSLPHHAQLKVEASYLPHHTIGGDYYDFIEIGKDKILLCIADVSGKGIPAAILMSNFQAGLRMLSRRDVHIEEIVQELNLLINQNSQGENFITAFFLLYDFNTQYLQYVNAGHNPPFLFTKDKVEHLDKGTTILGTFTELPFCEVGEIKNIKEFFVFCFTDGFIETYNEKGEEFGEDYLLKIIEENIEKELKDLHTTLISILTTFKGKKAYVDDITLLSCKVKVDS